MHTKHPLSGTVKGSLEEMCMSFRCGKGSSIMSDGVYGIPDSSCTDTESMKAESILHSRNSEQINRGG